MELILEVTCWRRPELVFFYELNNVVNGMEMLVRQFEFPRSEISCIYLIVLFFFVLFLFVFVLFSTFPFFAGQRFETIASLD